MSDNQEQILNAEEPLSSQQPKKVVHIEMFRAGPQISSSGQKMMFTEQDLDEVIGTYAPDRHEAPLIIGHDQTDSTPALGWVKNLWRKGAQLWGKVELTPKAEKLIKEGVFKKVSSSFYLPDAETNPHPGKLALRHLGLVSIPAVKGLTAFSEGEFNDEKIINLAPQEGETVISFKEALETNNSTMTRKKKTTDVAQEVSVDHAEGGMTVNINIGGGGGKPSVYDDSGNQVDETGAPADYKMEYATDEDSEDEMSSDMDTEALDGEGGDDMGLEDDSAPEEGAEGEMPEDSGMEGEGEEEGGSEEMDSEGEGEEPAGEDGVEDISGDMENKDKVVASLAAKYDEDELFQALALKKQASSMMEKDMSYGEMPEGLKKHMEEKEDKEGEGNEEEKKEDTDMSEEQVSDNAEETAETEEPKADMAEDKMEDEEEDDEEKKKVEMGEVVKEEKKEESADHSENAEPLATETLDHSESAMGDQSIDTLNARVAELEEELNRQRKLAREKEISSFAEGLYETGKLTEQVVPKGDLVRFMETLNNKNSVNFSEAGKVSQFDFFRGVLESLPSMVSFEEFATPSSAPKKKSVEPNASGYAYDPNTADLHVEALSYAEEHDCDYLTAVKFVIDNKN